MRSLGWTVVAALAVSAAMSAEQPAQGRVGLASYYARSLDGNVTASGDRFDNDALVAAHPTYPFGTRVRVTNLQNGRVVTLRIVDRGPVLAARRKGVMIDVSRVAAVKLGIIQRGLARVRVEVLE